MTGKNIILQAKGIYKHYRMGAAVIKVLRGINLKLKNAEFAAIVGASGSGKSTLLHLLGALDVPNAGSVKFNGRDLQKLTARQLNEFRNRKVGFVFQFYHLLDELNVLENVLLPAMVSRTLVGWFASRKGAEKTAAELIARLGLENRIKHKPYQLSGGERQRVAIARAMMNQPDILLVDEPTGNLDSETGNDILNIFENLNEKGQTILMVTHDKKIAERANRIITLADGKVTEA